MGDRPLSNEDLEDIEDVLEAMGKAETIPFNGKTIKLQLASMIRLAN